MEEKIRSDTRRTRFIDDEQENLLDINTNSIFRRNSSIAPVLAVLHDAVPNLESRCKASAGARISGSSSTLANLTAEFNDLSQKMTLLKKTIKANCSGSDTRKPGPKQIDSSSQALQICNLIDIVSAKQVIRDCISELTFINHVLEGYDETASGYREILRNDIQNEYGQSEAIVMQHVYLSPITEDQSTITREKSTIDSAVGVSDHHFNQNKKETDIQTEAPEQIAMSESSTDKTFEKSSTSHPRSKPTDETDSKQSNKPTQKKGRKW